MNLTIIVSPCPPAPYPKKWAGLFEARFNGRVLVAGSRQPLLDAARVLVSEGHDPETTITMRHAGSDHDALSAKLGVAAKLTVDEAHTRFHKWQPFQKPPKPTMGSRILGLPEMPGHLERESSPTHILSEPSGYPAGCTGA
jgi:hypothetical protein